MDPVRPATVPPDVMEAAHAAFTLTTGSDEDRLRAAVAAALNLVREAQREAEAGWDRALADLEQAREDLERVRSLLEEWRQSGHG